MCWCWARARPVLAAAYELKSERVCASVSLRRATASADVFSRNMCQATRCRSRLGAEFIHGRPPESFALAEQAGLLVYEIAGDSWLAQDGQLAPSDALWAQTDLLFAQMASAGDPDSSFQTFLARFQGDPAWRDAAAMAASYVEGFDAADTSTISVQALLNEHRAAAASDGDRAFRIAQGYDQLVAALAARCDPSRVALHLGRIARRVIWRRGHVELETEGVTGLDRRSFTAPQAVMTLLLVCCRRPWTRLARFNSTRRLPIMWRPRASLRWARWSR